MIQDTIKDILHANGGFDAAPGLSRSGLTKQELRSLADGGDIEAAILLLIGLKSPSYKFWEEDFEDEDTHEMVKIDRCMPLEGTMFEEDPGEVADLTSVVLKDIANQSDEELKVWQYALSDVINVTPIIEKLVDDGDVDAMWLLGDRYAYAEPMDKENALKYYDMALAADGDRERYDQAMEWLNYSPLEHPQDLADDFDPRDSVIMISGHPLYLDQIGYMVEDLTKAHGTPGNECGLYVPLEFVFETLGFKWVHNTGSLMRFTRHSEPVLTLEIECNPQVDDALVEAFRKAYPLLTVEVVDNSPGE